jgi:hypothetical protein
MIVFCKVLSKNTLFHTSSGFKKAAILSSKLMASSISKSKV